MKKQYEAPVAEKIEFCYRDQVVASGCYETNTHPAGTECADNNINIVS